MPTSESDRWAEFGRFLADQRDKLGLSRRDAAKRSQLSESTWKVLEVGHKERTGGIRVLPNPTTEVLKALSTTLEVPLETLLAKSGRIPADSRRRPALLGRPSASEEKADLMRKVSRLEDRDRHLVESLVDSMLAET